jgi:catechol 2,3-dioxygenase-like lactoylglutathione lyase family enzyme
MIDHMSVTVGDLERAALFYGAALGALCDRSRRCPC